MDYRQEPQMCIRNYYNQDVYFWPEVYVVQHKYLKGITLKGVAPNVT